MKTADRHILFYQTAVALVAAAIPWQFIAGSISIGVLAVAWVACGGFRTLRSQLKTQPALLLPVCYWLLFAVSFFWSSNRGEALFDMQTKLPLLVLPLLAGCNPGRARLDMRRVFAAFAGSVSVIALMCIGLGGYRYAVTGNSNHLFYHDLVDAPFLEVNAVYFSWYVITAIALLLFWPFRRPEQGGRFYLLRGAATVLLFLFLILLASRTLVAAGCLLFAFWLLRRVRASGRGQWAVVAGGGAAIALFFVLIFNTSNPLRGRYDAIFKSSAPGKEIKDGKIQLHFTNLTLRTFLWETAVAAVSEERLWAYGAGAGDVMDLQKRQIDGMTADGYDFSYNENLWTYNLHNMYIQSLAATGIPGVIFLLLMLVFGWMLPARSALRYAGRIFILVSFLFMFQESALQTQAGTVFFALFISFCLKKGDCRGDITK